MKNNTLIALAMCALTAIVLSGCQKINGHSISPNTGTSTATSGYAYLPTTSGTSWTMASDYSGTKDTSTLTLTGVTAIFNGFTCVQAQHVSKSIGTSIGYLGYNNQMYIYRGYSLSSGETVDFPYLVDNQPVGYSWTRKANDNGTVGGVTARFVCTITEVGITKTVFNHTFSNVIHTSLDLQYDPGTGYVSTAVYDFYIAKGVGIIETDTNINIMGFTSVSTSKLLSYTIK